MALPQDSRNPGEVHPELVCTRGTAGIQSLQLDVDCVEFKHIENL